MKTRADLQQLIAELVSGPLCMRPQHFHSLAAAEAVPVKAFYDDDDDEEDEPDEKDYPVTEDGIALIPIAGVLTPGRSWYGTSYADIEDMCEDAFEDPAVKAVLFCVNSGGGAASGMFDLADQIFQSRGSKPTAAISNDACYSAAYALASSAEKVFLTRTGGVGSIGVWSAHVDMSGFEKKMGVKVTLVYSGEKKVDGNPHEALSDRAKSDMQAETDRVYGMFVQLVARNRGADAQKIYDTEAGCFMAENALPLLADQVGTVEDALSYLRGQIATAALENVDDETAITEITDLNGGATNPFKKFQIRRSATRKLKIAEIVRFDQSVQNALARFEPQRLRLIKEFPGIESAIRVFGSSGVGASDRKISGLVVPYGQMSTDLGGYKEIYQRGCFNECLKNGQDIRGLLNHNVDYVLGRVSAGTARFFEQADGLRYEYDAPKTQWADDLLVSMRRGDIDQASAAFFILQHRWETRDGFRVRIVERGLMLEASVVTFAAYETTKAQAAQPTEPSSDTQSLEHEQVADRLRLLGLS